jgi:hypothetical protein
MICNYCKQNLDQRKEIVVSWYRDKYHSECFIALLRSRMEAEDEMQSALSKLRTRVVKH